MALLAMRLVSVGTAAPCRTRTEPKAGLAAPSSRSSVTTKGLQAVFRAAQAVDLPAMALEAHAAAAGDHGFLPLVPDPELEADPAPDVQAALVHGPAIGEVAPGDHLEQGALALGGEVHDLGKGGFLLHAADAVGGFGQVEDPDAGHAVDGQLGSRRFSGTG